MVVKCCNTVIAVLAVLTPQRLFDVTYRAVFGLNKQDDLICRFFLINLLFIGLSNSGRLRISRIFLSVCCVYLVEDLVLELLLSVLGSTFVVSIGLLIRTVLFYHHSAVSN
jgi:hypothetical protein